MLVHVLRRLWSTLTVAVGVAAVIFILLHLSGDPVALLVPADAPPEVTRDTRRALGLDRPLPQQFLIYLSRAAAAISAPRCGTISRWPSSSASDCRAPCCWPRPPWPWPS